MTNIADDLYLFTDEVTKRFVTRIKFWTPDFQICEAQSVLGGLLARICSLSIEFALSPYFWNPLCSGAILRSITEALINMGWVALEPVPRAKLFIDFGLGQDKLDYEHLKAGNKTFSVPNDELNQISDALAAQRHFLFTDVNVGTWSGVSVSKMAEEAGLPEYALLFAGLCGTVHSNWLLLHDRFIGADDTPNVPMSMPVQVGYLFTLAKFVDQAFDIYDAVCNFSGEEQESMLVMMQNWMQANE